MKLSLTGASLALGALVMVGNAHGQGASSSPSSSWTRQTRHAYPVAGSTPSKTLARRMDDPHPANTLPPGNDIAPEPIPMELSGPNMDVTPHGPIQGGGYSGGPGAGAMGGAPCADGGVGAGMGPGMGGGPAYAPGAGMVGGAPVGGGIVDNGMVGGGYIDGGYVDEGVAGGEFLGYPGGGVGGGCWFVGGSGLFMTRDRNDDKQLTTSAVDFFDTRITQRSAAMDWSGGFQARFGRYFNGGRNAVEAIYWGLFPDDQSITAIDYGNLTSSLDFGSLTSIGDFGGGLAPNAVNAWYTNADTQRLTRGYQFHNVEVNLLGGSLCSGVGAYAFNAPGCCNNRLSLSWLAGVRYFRFTEDFELATSFGDPTYDNSLNDMFYNIDVENNLVGGQIGARGQYCLTNKLSFYSAAKVGVYGNHITHHSRVGNAYGAAYVDDPTAGYWNGAAFDIHSTKNDVAILSEIDLGVAYCITCNLKATFGWRTLGLTGVALTENQIPRNFTDLGDVYSIDSTSSLILTGGYAGLEYNF